jgi:hypothetical protein
MEKHVGEKCISTKPVPEQTYRNKTEQNESFDKTYWPQNVSATISMRTKYIGTKHIRTEHIGTKPIGKKI